MSAQARPTAQRVALLAVLVMAAALRFIGLTHHLARGGPEYDERTIVVDPVLRMWRTGSLDPVVYTGYAGFFNYLAAVPVRLGLFFRGEVGAAAGARALVAAFSVLSVGLAYAVARPRLGAPGALLAAALLALSPLEVRSAHYITADVAVGTAMLAALLVLQRGRDAPDEIAAGALLGAATAAKYTGLLLAVAIVVDRLVKGRARGLWRVALAAAAAFALCAPYALLQAGHQGSELAFAFQSYYGRDAAANRMAQGDASQAAAPLFIVAGALGPVGCALALAALLLFRDRRALLPWLAVAAGAVVFLAPANLVYPRHLVPAAAVVPLLAGAGWLSIGERLRSGPARAAALAALGVAALVPPGVESVRLVARYARTPAVDRAAEWIEGHVAAGGTLAVELDRFVLDPARFEVRTVRSLRELGPELRAQFDLLVATRRQAEGWTGLTTLARFESEEPDEGLALLVLRPASPRPATPLAPGPVRASQPDGMAAAWDDDPRSVWTAPGGAGFTETTWSDRFQVDRVEIEAGPGPDAWPQDLVLLGTADGEAWMPLPSFALRPNRPARQRGNAPHGQVYVLTPRAALRGLRIERPAGGPWSLAAVRVTGTSPPSPSRAAR